MLSVGAVDLEKRQHAEVVLEASMAVGQKTGTKMTGTKMGCPGKWNQGLKPAVPLESQYQEYIFIYIYIPPFLRLQTDTKKGEPPVLGGQKKRRTWSLLLTL